MKIDFERGSINIDIDGDCIIVNPTHYNQQLKPYEIQVLIAALQSAVEQYRRQNPHEKA